MQYRRSLFCVLLIIIFLLGVFPFIRPWVNASPQPNPQFFINAQGNALDRDQLFRNQPLGVVTLKIVYNPGGNDTVLLDLTKPRIGTDQFVQNVLKTVGGWSWQHPKWVDGVAYLTIDMIQQRVHFDLSDLWRKFVDNNQTPLVFPNPDKERTKYLKYSGFYDDNVIITLPPRYMKQVVETTSSIKLLYQRLTPWFLGLFLIMLFIAAKTIAQYLASLKFIIFTAIVSVAVFFLLFNFAQPDTLSILVYWGFWIIILGIMAYYFLVPKSVLDEAKLEGDSEYLKKIEKEWMNYLIDTIDLMQENDKENWDKKVGQKLQKTIQELEHKLSTGNIKKKDSRQPVILDLNKLSEKAKKELGEISLQASRAYSELTEKFNEEFLIRFKNEQNLSDQTFHELEAQLPKEKFHINAVDTKNWPSFARILHAGMTNHRNNRLEQQASQEIDRSVDRAIESEIESLKAEGLETLWSFGSIAPMIGLLGTVVGIASSFGKIAKFSGGIEQSELIHRLAGGINVALYTTITGLIIGLTSLLFYYLIKFRLDQLRNKWESRMVDITNRL